MILKEMEGSIRLLFWKSTELGERIYMMHLATKARKNSKGEMTI